MATMTCYQLTMFDTEIFCECRVLFKTTMAFSLSGRCWSQKTSTRKAQKMQKIHFAIMTARDSKMCRKEGFLIEKLSMNRFLRVFESD